ncbi:MAG TPA: class III signal peptide-containing protein [Methanobacteriaceae archaeon]|nr:class III signal peptide-containing protein [Methanobacteriaceae archaeon]
MNDRGQISAEYILMMGFIIVVVILVATFAGEQNEQNTVAAAVRDGAANSSAELSILNKTLQPVRVTSVETINGDPITIKINLSNNALLQSQKQLILQGSQKSLEGQGFTVDNQGSYLLLSTGRHNYNVTVA